MSGFVFCILQMCIFSLFCHLHVNWTNCLSKCASLPFKSRTLCCACCCSLEWHSKTRATECLSACPTSDGLSWHGLFSGWAMLTTLQTLSLTPEDHCLGTSWSTKRSFELRPCGHLVCQVLALLVKSQSGSRL